MNYNLKIRSLGHVVADLLDFVFSSTATYRNYLQLRYNRRVATICIKIIGCLQLSDDQNPFFSVFEQHAIS